MARPLSVVGASRMKGASTMSAGATATIPHSSTNDATRVNNAVAAAQTLVFVPGRERIARKTDGPPLLARSASAATDVVALATTTPIEIRVHVRAPLNSTMDAPPPSIGAPAAMLLLWRRAALSRPPPVVRRRVGGATPLCEIVLPRFAALHHRAEYNPPGVRLVLPPLAAPRRAFPQPAPRRASRQPTPQPAFLLLLRRCHREPTSLDHSRATTRAQLQLLALPPLIIISSIIRPLLGGTLRQRHIIPRRNIHLHHLQPTPIPLVGLLHSTLRVDHLLSTPRVDHLPSTLLCHRRATTHLHRHHRHRAITARHHRRATTTRHRRRTTPHPSKDTTLVQHPPTMPFRLAFRHPLTTPPLALHLVTLPPARLQRIIRVLPPTLLRTPRTTPTATTRPLIILPIPRHRRRLPTHPQAVIPLCLTRRATPPERLLPAHTCRRLRRRRTASPRLLRLNAASTQARHLAATRLARRLPAIRPRPRRALLLHRTRCRAPLLRRTLRRTVLQPRPLPPLEDRVAAIHQGLSTLLHDPDATVTQIHQSARDHRSTWPTTSKVSKENVPLVW
mmetsp:Transcript_32516/g.81505  ORF Transcript_32516/g.81505 Transcript_32516/m.81505 type:complete len:563 (-) Transcript_32516:65-1753(-)